MTPAEWDRRYRAAPLSLPEPDPLLAEARAHLPEPREALVADVACGGGRNALRLAGWGYRVEGLDRSAEALRLCERRARATGLSMATRLMDLEGSAVDLGSGRFNIVMVFNYLHRPLIPALRRSVSMGGIVIYKTYTAEQANLPHGPSNPRFLLEPNELPELFAGFRTLIYRETCDPDATASLVAQRP